jgi:hypothetical protein
MIALVHILEVLENFKKSIHCNIITKHKTMGGNNIYQCSTLLGTTSQKTSKSSSTSIGSSILKSNEGTTIFK